MNRLRNRGRLIGRALPAALGGVLFSAGFSPAVLLAEDPVAPTIRSQSCECDREACDGESCAARQPCRDWIRRKIAHLNAFVQPCPDYPLGCMPPDPGATMHNFFGAMDFYAEQDDFVIYNIEWAGRTSTPDDDLALHLERIAPRLPVEPFPVVIEPSGSIEVDAERRAYVLHQLATILAKLIATDVPVVPVRHLGPRNYVTHLPVTGPLAAGGYADCPPCRTFAAPAPKVAVVDSAALAKALETLAGRVFVGPPVAEGQLSDGFGRRSLSGFGGQGGQGGGRGGGGFGGSSF